MRNYIAILFLLAIFQKSYTQSIVLSPVEINADLDYLNKYLKKWHPAYYSYTSKTKMNAYLDSLKTNSKPETTLQEFKTKVKKTIDKVGCGHIGIGSPKYYKGVDSALSLPFDVNVLNSKLYVRKYLGQDSLMKNGDEILSINGIKAIDLIQELGTLISSDGYNKTHKDYYLEKSFFIYFLQIYGQLKYSKIEILTENFQQKTVEINHVFRSKYDDYLRNKIDSSKIIIKGKNINLQKTNINDKTFLIDFNKFFGPHLRKSYRQIFSYLRKNKAENLIIDVRDNGGGNVFGGFNFMKYLLKEPIQFFNISRKPNLTILNPNFKVGFFERIAPLFFMANPLQYPSKRGWNHTFFFLKHFKNHYDKNLYVITNGMTFSTAAVTTTLLKNKAQAIVVGEETGGSSYANRGMAQGKIILPNSKLQVIFNVYQLKYGHEPDTGHGVVPHHDIKYNFEERNNKIDKEMIKIEELIKQSKLR